MRTSLTEQYLNSSLGQEADSILRKCVHCGFCNATCPTYQITGDELDGPRGRIYQIKQILEGDAATPQTMLHLDRCLTCRNCETTCPSGVEYARLLETGRTLVEESVPRELPQRLFRTALRSFLLSPLFQISLGIGRLIRPLTFGSLRNSIPLRHRVPRTDDVSTHRQRVLLIQGCVQKSLQPAIDAAAIKLFDQVGIQAILSDSNPCCGALSLHLSAEERALEQARRNIDSWLHKMEAENIERITMTASGCGVMLQDYLHLFADDVYADKARRISEAYLDPAEIVDQQRDKLGSTRVAKRIAFHPPCTQQHGQKITGVVESLLTSLGHEIVTFDETHLCCGSAGTYSITQPELSSQLRTRKLSHIESTQPDIIATANIGCQTHLQAGTDIPVRHWLELLAE